MKMKRSIIFALSLFTMIVFLSSCGRNTLELYGIKYGESKYPSERIFHGDTLKNPVDFVWMFYAIKYNDRTILIDTGFSDKKLASSFDVDHSDPLELLQEIGIYPDDVTDVIVTHRHFDHTWNLSKFKNANIYIQQKEFEWLRKRVKNQELRSFLNNSKNIVTFNDGLVIYDIFDISKIGGHTEGSSIVSFERPGKTYFLVGDEIYLLKNLSEEIPSGTHFDLNKNRTFINHLSKKKDIVVLPFHDPSVPGKKKIIKII